MKFASVLPSFRRLLWCFAHKKRQFTKKKSNYCNIKTRNCHLFLSNLRAMAVNIPGLVSIIIFYLLILFIGLWAGWKQRKNGTGTDNIMLAGRNIGVFVGIFTMTGKQS